LKSFQSFRLDTANQCLWRGPERVAIPPKPYDMLRYLVENPGRLVTHDELLEKLWPEIYVNPELIRKYILDIRKILADRPDKPEFIETVTKRGYRFIAPVIDESATPPPELGPQKRDTESGRSASVSSGSAAVERKVGSHVTPQPPLSQSSPLPGVPSSSTGVKVAEVTGTSGRLWKILIPATAILVAAIGGWFYFRSHRTATALTEKDAIVLGDFTNTTGDAIFDDTLKTALSVSLRQSPFLNVLSDSEVTKTLQEMTRPVGTKLTPEVARELCQRAGSKAYLAGTIGGLGSQYVLGLKAVNCQSGDTLAEEQVTAASKEKVLDTLGAAASKLRGELGESLSSVQKYETPVADATTSSLEALKAYSLGRKTRFAKGETAALPFFKRAVELDPKFALAYRAMAVAYSDVNEIGRAAEYSRKAHDLREKVSERERFSIDGFYYLIATGELEKAAQTYELWKQTYPRDSIPYGNLGYIYVSLGNYEKALEESREALRLEPNNWVSYLNVGGGYTSLNRLDEAEVVYKQAEERRLESETLLLGRYQLAFLKGDAPKMAQLASAAMGKQGTEDLLLAAQADTEGWYGKLKNAHELTRRAMNSAQHNDAKESAASYQAAAALREVESGNQEQARADANAALKLAPNRDVRVVAAQALARAGDTTAAERLVAELDKTFPLDTLVQRYWLPTIRAAVALERKDPNRAIELLKDTSTIELGQAPSRLNIFLCPPYIVEKPISCCTTATERRRNFRSSLTTGEWW
jgi:DNA-binding winged helix-turn-helix (wHTH) protein/tetratricopeptide (TPR) repeat protein